MCADRTCQAEASEKSGPSLPIARCCFWQVTLGRPEHGGRETPAVCRRRDLRDDGGQVPAQLGTQAAREVFVDRLSSSLLLGSSHTPGTLHSSSSVIRTRTGEESLTSISRQGTLGSARSVTEVAQLRGHDIPGSHAEGA